MKIKYPFSAIDFFKKLHPNIEFSIHDGYYLLESIRSEYISGIDYDEVWDYKADFLDAKLTEQAYVHLLISLRKINSLNRFPDFDSIRKTQIISEELLKIQNKSLLKSYNEFTTIDKN